MRHIMLLCLGFILSGCGQSRSVGNGDQSVLPDGNAVQAERGATGDRGRKADVLVRHDRLAAGDSRKPDAHRLTDARRADALRVVDSRVVDAKHQAVDQQAVDRRPLDKPAVLVDMKPVATDIYIKPDTCPVGTPCDDGSLCTYGDKIKLISIAPGQWKCGCQGTKYTCKQPTDPGLWCTRSTCDGAGGCSPPTQYLEACIVGGKCYRGGPTTPPGFEGCINTVDAYPACTSGSLGKPGSHGGVCVYGLPSSWPYWQTTYCLCTCHQTSDCTTFGGPSICVTPSAVGVQSSDADDLGVGICY